MRFGITLSSFLEVLARLKCCWSFCFRKMPCRERTRTKDMIVAGFGHELFFFCEDGGNGGVVDESLFRVSDFDLPLWSACLVVNLFGSSGRFVHLESVAAEVTRRMSPNSEGFGSEFFGGWKGFSWMESSGRFIHLENVAAEVARRMSPNSEGKSFLGRGGGVGVF